MRVWRFNLAVICCLAAAVALGARASAQLARPAGVPLGGGGITTTGRSSVLFRPDVVRFTVRFSMRPPSIDALLSEIDTVVQAFVKAGIDQQSLSREMGPIYAPSQGIQLTISGATKPAPPAQLAKMYGKVMDSLGNVSGLTFQGFSAGYGLQDCAFAQEQARRSAIADAHQRAQAIAHDAGVTLGAVTAVNEVPYGPVCDGVVVQQTQNGALEMSPQPMVTVTSQITVTYAIAR